MGCGPGPGRGIPLSEYQEQVTDAIMTVSGDDYTFVANHTILAEEEIIFGATDTLTINAGVDVILEGKLYVIDETDGITRITVNGTFTMDEGSEIEICGIRNGGVGISVNTGGIFTQNGGDIRITTVDDTNSAGIEVTGVGAVFNAFAGTGTIQIDTVTNNAVGIRVATEGTFIQNGTNITITNVTIQGTGISVFSSGSATTYTQTTGNITITTVSGTGLADVTTSGILVTGVDAVFAADGGTIQIDNVINLGIGIRVATEGAFTQNGTDITITNVNGGGGILVGVGAVFDANAGTIQIDIVNDFIGILVFLGGVFTQNGTDITITNVNATPVTTSVGILVGEDSVFTATAGTIELDAVTNRAIGIRVVNGGEFTQDVTDITFGKLTNDATAIEIESDSTFTKQNGSTISITNPSAGGGTSGMVVTGTIAGSVVTNLGPNGSINMTNSDTPYTPTIDPFGNPWDGVGSLRAFYAP